MTTDYIDTHTLTDPISQAAIWPVAGEGVQNAEHLASCVGANCSSAICTSHATAGAQRLLA